MQMDSVKDHCSQCGRVWILMACPLDDTAAWARPTKASKSFSLAQRLNAKHSPCAACHPRVRRLLRMHSATIWLMLALWLHIIDQ